MAGLQLSGLASGFDWKSVVDQLMQIERVPQDRLRTTKSGNTSKLSAFSALGSKITALQDAAKKLGTDQLFSQRTVSLSDADLKWTATAGSGAVAGEYTFNVTKLASRSVRTGANDIASGLSATNDVSGLVVSEMRLAAAVTSGVFSINGKQVRVDGTDTLQDVFDRISAATGGEVTASYDAATDRVSLASGGALSLGSGMDTSNFLFALKLHNNGGASVSSASALGGAALRESIAAAGLRAAVTAVDGAGAGSFEINGVTIAFNVATDTVQDVMSRVNASEAGVTMAYDAAADRFTLSNKTTGDLGIAVTESAGGLLGALGLTGSAVFARGANAEFSINDGGTIVAASNTLGASAHGVTGLTVTATRLGEQTVSVAPDTASLSAGIRDFIAKFNDVQSYIDQQTRVSTSSDGKVTSALLAGNRELALISRDLRSRIFDQVGGLSGTIRRLEGLGIDFEGRSNLLAVRDEAKLADGLSGNLQEVSALFTSATTGISARVQDYATTLTATGGSLANQRTTLERQNRSLDNQIADIERRLVAERTRLEGSFIRMEQAQSLIQSQLSALQSTLNLS